MYSLKLVFDSVNFPILQRKQYIPEVQLFVLFPSPAKKLYILKLHKSYAHTVKKPSWHFLINYVARCVCAHTNRPISQMRAPLAACREPAGKLWQLCNVLYVFEHKAQ